MRFLKMKTLIVLVLFISSVSVFAQTKKDAVDAYNKGAALVNSDPAAAIEAFDKCVSISEQLDEEGEETINMAGKQLPLMHYKVASSNYKKKDYKAAIEAFEQAKQSAEKYNNEEIANKANKAIPQVYNISGSNHYRNKKYEDAMICFGKSIEYKPNYAKPYLGQALVYKKQDDIDNMLANCDQAIEIGVKTKDKKTVASAQKLAMNTMFNMAVAAIGKSQWTDAESSLNKSIEYGNNSAEVRYQLGKVYNAEKKWDNAITSLNKAIELDEGDNGSKARYYFELGNSHVGSGNTAAACTAFKSAMHGDYVEQAKYQVEQVLKCQ